VHYHNGSLGSNRKLWGRRSGGDLSKTGRVCEFGTIDDHITRRELDVLMLAAADLGDSEIAEELFVSVSTVHDHMKNMRRKADVRTRAGLLVRCYAVGILVPGGLPPAWSGRYCLHLPQDARQRISVPAALKRNG
jgi:DNA-binding CsgD family transcriptional regulator